MKKVTVVAVCDNVHEAGEALGTIERILSIDGSKPMEVDLCPECDEHVLALLAVLENAAEQAKKVKAEGKKSKVKKDNPDQAEQYTETGEKGGQFADEPSTCPICGHVSPRRTALGQHLRAAHSKGFRDLRREGIQVA